MKRRCSRFIFILGALTLTLVLSRSQTNTLIVPREAETAFGDSFGDPFFFNSDVEQIYSASEFATAPDVIRITEVGFRVNESPGRDLDAVIPRVLLRMNVFQGSMQEIVERQSGVQNPVTVFDRENVHLTGRAGQTDAFDVRFPLQTPFEYDRRLGQLVLNIVSGGGLGQSVGMDAHSISFDRGAYIRLEPLGRRAVTPRMMVTGISYKIISAIIDSISRDTDRVQIDFSLFGAPDVVRVESSMAVTGIFKLEESAELSTISEGRMRAIIPFSADDRFFRIQIR